MKTKLLLFGLFICISQNMLSQPAIFDDNNKTLPNTAMNTEFLSDLPLYCTIPNFFDPGFYGKMNIPDVDTFEMISTSPIEDFENAGDISILNNKIGYVFTQNTNKFYKLDVLTGTYEFLGLIPSQNQESWTGLEFDPTNNNLYGLSTDFLGNSTLYIIDPEKVEAEVVGKITNMPAAIAIAMNLRGRMYGYDVETDALYTISKSTAQATLVGNIGFDANFGQDLEWDYVNNVLYMMGFNRNTRNSELRTVDISTGATSVLSISERQIIWISFSTDNILSVENEHEDVSEFKLFPNPVNDKLNIVNASNKNIESIEVYSLEGKKVMTSKLNAISTPIIQVDNLASGLYMLKINGENGKTITTKKFIKK